MVKLALHIKLKKTTPRMNREHGQDNIPEKVDIFECLQPCNSPLFNCYNYSI